MLLLPALEGLGGLALVPGRPLLPLLLPGLPTGGAGVTLWLAGAGAALPADGVGGAVGGGREEVLGLAGEGACCACVCRGGGRTTCTSMWVLAVVWVSPFSNVSPMCGLPVLTLTHPTPQHSTCSHPSTPA